MTKEQTRKEAQHQLENGHIIEAGWIVNVLSTAPPGTPSEHLYVSHNSFFFGARYMLETMVALQANGVPDHAMEKIVANIRKELDNFGRALEGDAMPGIH